MRINFRRPWIFGLAAMTAMVGGVAIASIPDTDGVFHGCHKNSTGALRLVDTSPVGVVEPCKGGETPVSWSQTGPEGPQGEPGASGTGTHHAFFGPGGATLSPNGPFHTVVSLELPSGSYVLEARVVVEHIDSDAGQAARAIVACSLVGSGSSLYLDSPTLAEAGNLQREMEITSALDDFIGGLVELECSNGSSLDEVRAAGTLLATAVDSVTVTAPSPS